MRDEADYPICQIGQAGVVKKIPQPLAGPVNASSYTLIPDSEPHSP